MATTMIAQQIHNGFSYTLTTKLGDILNYAEAQYGKRDYSYTILGIEFYNLPIPQVWYPQNCKHYAIQLTARCLIDFNEGIYELAHEVIHCLSPTAGQFPATVLEEGIATYFAVDYTQKNGHGNFSNITDQRYKNAYNLFSQLIAFDIDIIKKVRQVQPTISLIAHSEIIAINNTIPIQLATDLTQIF
ncbi:MAG: hypothetical protein KKG99_09655 [Bacteroidetes bacterium]|nr:hypothetical protein [Bacteroidota bacterium]